MRSAATRKMSQASSSMCPGRIFIPGLFGKLLGQVLRILLEGFCVDIGVDLLFAKQERPHLGKVVKVQSLMKMRATRTFSRMSSMT